MARLSGKDCAHMQSTEGARAEGAERVERGNYGVGVLQEQTAGGGQRKDGAERAVEGLDF